MFTLASRSSNVPIVAERLTHAKNTSTWVAFCMTSLQLITPPCNTRRSIIDNKNAMFRGEHAPSGPPPVAKDVDLGTHHSNYVAWKFPHPGILALGISRQVWGFVTELIPGLHLPVHTRSWWTISGGNRVARLFDCSRSKSDCNRRRFS